MCCPVPAFIAYKNSDTAPGTRYECKTGLNRLRPRILASGRAAARVGPGPRQRQVSSPSAAIRAKAARAARGGTTSAFGPVCKECHGVGIA